MQYYEFHARFVGACRVRHIEPEQLGWRWLQRRLRRHLPGRNAKDAWKRQQSMRRCRVPARAELPARFIGLDPWEAEYLFALSSRARRGIVEIGRRTGGSVFMMACANDKVPIYSIDIQPVDDERLRGLFSDKGVGSRVQLIVGDSQRGQYPQIESFDLLFVDGDHSYEGCSRDLENFYHRLEPGGSIVLHDCFFGCEVQDAVIDFLARHSDVVPVFSPHTPASHWLQPQGSLAHLRKLPR